MKIDENRIYIFLSKGMPATLSVVAASFLALYLASIDDKIGVTGNGVFSLQTSFSPDVFSAILNSWNPAVKNLFMKYLYFDMIFAAVCAVCFPAMIALLFTQYKEILQKIGVAEIAVEQYKARDKVIFFAPAALFFSITGNVMILFLLTKGTAAAPLTYAIGLCQIIRILLLLSSLAFIMYILFKRRRFIKQLYSQG